MTTKKAEPKVDPERQTRHQEVNPEIFDKEDRFLVGRLPYLDELEAQIKENRDAKAEDREPRAVRTRALGEPTGKALTELTTEHHYFQNEADERAAVEREEGISNSGVPAEEDQTEEEKKATTAGRQDDSAATRSIAPGNRK